MVYNYEEADDVSQVKFPAFNAEMFDDAHARLIEDELNIIQQGRKEYAHTENVFANFNRLGNLLGMTPEQVLMVYAYKHLDGILSWINGHKSQREDVRGRIVDLRNYLAILYGMVEAYDKWELSPNPETLPKS